MPSHNAINANAHALARYAALCQEAGIVPIVEPEVLMDGPLADHDIDTCYAVTEWTLKTVFSELYYAGVRLDGMVLKPNMVIAGKNCPKQASPAEVAEKTVQRPEGVRSRRPSPASPSCPAASPTSRRPSICR